MSKRGGYRPGAGRPKGAKNKATTDVRAAVVKMAEGMAGEVQEWIHEISEQDKVKAVELWLKVIEYHIPKIGRVEHTGKDGQALPDGIRIYL